MALWKKLLASASALALVSGGVIAASASTTKTTNVKYSACLNSIAGTLSKVTMNGALKCPSAEKLISWNARGPKGLKGSPGSPGPSGAAGARGSLWSTGSGVPSVTASQQSGDLYLDTATGNVYEDVAGAWTPEGNTKGPQGQKGSAGSPGIPGAAGARGSLWSTGSGAPSLSVSQQSGDLYLDTATGNVYEVVTGAWTLEDNIQGPAGTNGDAYNCSAAAYPGVNYDGCGFSLSFYFAEDFADAQFAGADLSGSYLYGSSNFDNANFSGATINNSYLYNDATFTNANFTGANLTDSFLYAGAGFTNANFTGANLTGAYLYAGADFTNANFTGANLTGAFLADATLSTATWSNTTCPGGTNSSAYSPQTCVGH
jgi:hypothetical protein